MIIVPVFVRNVVFEVFQTNAASFASECVGRNVDVSGEGGSLSPIKDLC
jgi:hypothetical protein